MAVRPAAAPGPGRQPPRKTRGDQPSSSRQRRQSQGRRWRGEPTENRTSPIPLTSTAGECENVAALPQGAALHVPQRLLERDPAFGRVARKQRNDATHSVFAWTATIRPKDLQADPSNGLADAVGVRPAAVRLELALHLRARVPPRYPGRRWRPAPSARDRSQRVTLPSRRHPTPRWMMSQCRIPAWWSRMTPLMSDAVYQYRSHRSTWSLASRCITSL